QDPQRIVSESSAFVPELPPHQRVPDAPVVQPVANPPLPTGWQVFHSLKGGYSVWLPGMPIEKPATVATKRGEREMTQATLSDTTSGLTFLVSNAEFSDRIFPDADQALDAARDGALKNTKADLVSETPIALGVHPGRELRFSIPKAKGIELRMR